MLPRATAKRLGMGCVATPSVSAGGSLPDTAGGADEDVRRSRSQERDAQSSPSARDILQCALGSRPECVRSSRTRSAGGSGGACPSTGGATRERGDPVVPGDRGGEGERRVMKDLACGSSRVRCSLDTGVAAHPAAPAGSPQTRPGASAMKRTREQHSGPSHVHATSIAATFVALIVLLVGVPLPAAAQQATSADVLARTDSIFARMDSPTTPGCAVSVMQQGAIVFERGYGMANLEYGIPITPQSVFHVASVSKHFTAFAIELLVNEGRVSWDDDIRKYVPEVPDFGQPITLRHLVHHVSGIRDQWNLLSMAGWRWEADVVTQKDVLDIVSRQKALNFAPGERYLYSNTGYTLLAVVVERVTGQTLREFAQERMFEPLGMTQT